ncbi:MAG TPA: fimbria/pilus outer membrane usher protein [Candidatus Binatia bacterium]|nr:fimbria/pilus outer membrane usher protein [Candidatus Binatia bacterium]
MAARRRRLIARAALAVLLAAPAAWATQPPERPQGLPAGSDPSLLRCPAPEGTYWPRLLHVTINGADTRQELVFLQRPCGAVFARIGDLEALRIRAKDHPAVQIDGDSYLNLNAYDGVRFSLDESQQTLVLDGEPRVFYPTVLDLQPPPPPPPRAAPLGGFLNYGLFGSMTGEDRSLSATAGLGVFAGEGILLSDWIGSGGNGTWQTWRLGTSYVRDFPERIATLRLGDVAARGDGFGSAAPLAGVQWATNFQLRPGLILSPVQTMEAATRANADLNLYLNSLNDPDRASRAVFMSALTSVPYGPVELVNVPTYANGEYQMILRDSFGREVAVHQPFFFSEGLLRQGLHDYSYEGGALRKDFAGDEYGSAFASATHRYGFTARFTGEAHVEASSEGFALGVTGDRAVPYLGVVTATLAGAQSRLADGAGVFGAVSLENRYQHYAYALRGECADANFILPTVLSNPVAPPACREFASIARSLPGAQSVALSVAAIDARTGTDSRSVRLGYLVPFLHSAQLQLYAGWTRALETEFSGGLVLNVPFSAFGGAPRPRGPGYGLFEPSRTQASLNASGTNRGDPTAFARVSSGVSRDDAGFGVQLGAAVDGRDLQTLGLSWGQGPLSAVGGVQNSDGQESWTLGGASAIAFLDGSWFASRPLYSSFALVRLGEDYAGVRVNGVRANGDGDALVAPLQAYYENPVAVNAADLPMNARFSALSTPVVPRFRAGVVVHPDIRKVHDAMLTVQVRQADGTLAPLPAGAYASIEGVAETFPVGMDGAVYVAELAPSTRVVLHDRGAQCEITVTLPEHVPDNSIPELGPFVCEALTR